MAIANWLVAKCFCYFVCGILLINFRSFIYFIALLVVAIISSNYNTTCNIPQSLNNYTLQSNKNKSEAENETHSNLNISA